MLSGPDVATFAYWLDSACFCASLRTVWLGLTRKMPSTRCPLCEKSIFRSSHSTEGTPCVASSSQLLSALPKADFGGLRVPKKPRRGVAAADDDGRAFAKWSWYSRSCDCCACARRKPPAGCGVARTGAGCVIAGEAAASLTSTLAAARALLEAAVSPRGAVAPSVVGLVRCIGTLLLLPIGCSSLGCSAADGADAGSQAASGLPARGLGSGFESIAISSGCLFKRTQLWSDERCSAKTYVDGVMASVAKSK